MAGDPAHLAKSPHVKNDQYQKQRAERKSKFKNAPKGAAPKGKSKPRKGGAANEAPQALLQRGYFEATGLGD